MAACVLATGWFPLLAINSLPSQNYNEGWNAYRQWMALKGEPLYSLHSPFWTTNYGFLSFHIVGLLGGAKANMVLAGRILSFASLIAIVYLAGAIVRQATGSRGGALYAGLAVFAGICSFYGEGRAVDDPELLSAAFATFGLFAYLRASRRAYWLVLAAAAFCLSLFTKHDYIAFPFSVAAHLVWTRRWRPLAAFIAAGAVCTGGLLALSLHADGPGMLAALIQPRAYRLSHSVYQTLHYLLHFSPALVIALLTLWRGNGIGHRAFLFILLLVTNLAAVVLAGGDGVADNIFYPPIIADLLAGIIGICWLRRQGGRPFKLALACSAIGLAAAVPSRLYEDIQTMLRLPAATTAARQAAALLAATPGPAICEDLLLCYEAGKPLDYDPYYVKDQVLIGRLPDARVVGLLAAHRYAAIQLRGGLNGAWLPRMHLRFTTPFQRALPGLYQPVFVSRFYVVCVPAARPAAATRTENRAG